MKSALAALTILNVVMTAALAAQEPSATPEPEPSRWESHHSIRMAGHVIPYEAVVGSIILRDDQEGATAELFYTERTSGAKPIS